MTTGPAVLLVRVKNGGKSQMAAGLMRAAAGESVGVHSAAVGVDSAGKAVTGMLNHCS